MQLRNARLCLDCEEVHDDLKCPICASETFAYITRWVPVPEPVRPRPTTSTDADIYRELVGGNGKSSRGRRLLKQGAVAVTAIGLLGWLWQSRTRRPSPEAGDGRSAEQERARTI